MRTIESVRIAFIGVSHWHVPLYFWALEKANLNIVAVCDPDIKKAQSYADKYHCECYTEEDKLLKEVKPEFVFAGFPESSYRTAYHRKGALFLQNAGTAALHFRLFCDTFRKTSGCLVLTPRLQRLRFQ